MMVQLPFFFLHSLNFDSRQYENNMQFLVTGLRLKEDLVKVITDSLGIKK